jgi:hypothetical protein
MDVPPRGRRASPRLLLRGEGGVTAAPADEPGGSFPVAKML